MLVRIQQFTVSFGYLKCHAITIFCTVTETLPRVVDTYRENCMLLYGHILDEHVVDVEKWRYKVTIQCHANEPESQRWREVYGHRALKTVSKLL